MLMRATSAGGARARQRGRVAATCCDGRQTLVIGQEGGEGARAVPSAARASVDELLRRELPPAEVLALLDPVPGALVLKVVTVLAELERAGAGLVLALPPSQAELVAPLLPEARVLRQVAAEVVWLGAEEPQPFVMPPSPEQATIMVLLVSDVLDFELDVQVTGRAIQEQHHAALVEESTALRTANARLRSSHRPVESAAAANLLSRAPITTAGVAQLHARIDELEAEVEHVTGVAQHNDDHYQAARAIVEARDAEIRGLRSTLGRPQHRVAASAGYRVGRVPVLGRVAKRAAARVRL